MGQQLETMLRTCAVDAGQRVLEALSLGSVPWSHFIGYLNRESIAQQA